ncbi:DUF3108 domain-containing protein [Roseateles sp. DAIF2]|uniref:DUF3108 domain-containing protein n=1 Tax=Roseateles sp. DAIF2 TaxID=2714952 RepID=UPI0018A2DFCC|nr:DUF3108 domain-containing protein [Roseateles sp. DAIF2]QPF71934.1 DUF3108 domain-containing protein [Roseateles sp. DAIF2]
MSLRPTRRLLFALALAAALHAGLWVWLRPEAPRQQPASPPRAMDLGAAAPAVAAAPPLPAATQTPVPPRRTPVQKPPAISTAAPAPAATPVFKPPPTLHWLYRLRQGDEDGAARLQWQRNPDQYQARLERELPGRALPAWSSRGGFDAAGLAPERFAEQRGERERQAINFRREQGLISFSASRAQLALPPGAQDRLSWMLQLAALLEADAALRQPGARLSLPVAGQRGELNEWQFEVLEREDLTLPVGPISAALRLRREALGPYDARIEVWLDPARHYLPVRLRHSLGETQRWELELQQELWSNEP